MAKKLVKSTSTVAAMTMLSRVLGFMRDMIVAQIFGAGAGFDAFVIAFKIPNFFRRLFGEGAFSQAFVPVLAEYKETKSPEETQVFINRIAGNLGLALILVVIVAELTAPWVVTIFAPGFDHGSARFALTTSMLHITFPYLFFIGLIAFSGAVLNTMGVFSIPAFTPVLLNVCMIVAAYWWAPHTNEPIKVLAWGVFVAGIAQLALQIPFLMKVKALPRPSFHLKDPGVQRVLKLMLPALFGVSVAQISLLMDNFFASFLPVGSLSWLYFSDRLTYLPLGVVGVALATVVLPHLSRHNAKQNHQEFSDTVGWAMKCILVVGIPCAVGLFFLAGPILTTLFRHGKFNVRDVIMTTKSLRAFAIGLPGFMAIKILASAFYSKKDIKTPVKIAAFSLLINLILNIILVFPLKHAGLALATALTAFVNSGALFVLLIKRKYYQADKDLVWISLRIVVANVIMAAVIFWFTGDIAKWLDWTTLTRVWHLALLIVGGALIYFLGLFVVGLRLRHFRAPE